MAVSGDASLALQELSLNPVVGERKAEVAKGCAHCAKEGAAKRCAKRHANCVEKLFCDKTCESAAHNTRKEEVKGKEEEEEENVEGAKEATTAAKTKEGEKASKAKSKKAKKAANAAKKKGDGELWWNNSVYASW